MMQSLRIVGDVAKLICGRPVISLLTIVDLGRVLPLKCESGCLAANLQGLRSADYHYTPPFFLDFPFFALKKLLVQGVRLPPAYGAFWTENPWSAEWRRRHSMTLPLASSGAQPTRPRQVCCRALLRCSVGFPRGRRQR